MTSINNHRKLSGGLPRWPGPEALALWRGTGLARHWEETASGGPNSSPPAPTTRSSRRQSLALQCYAAGGRETTDKLKQERFQLAITKHIYTRRTVRQWNGLVRSCGASALSSCEDTNCIKPWVTWSDLTADCFELEVGLETSQGPFQSELS